MSQQIEVLGASLMMPMADNRRQLMAPGSVIDVKEVLPAFVRLLQDRDEYLTRFAALRGDISTESPLEAGGDASVAVRDAAGSSDGPEEPPPSPEALQEGASQSTEAEVSGTAEAEIDWDVLSDMNVDDLVEAATSESREIIEAIVRWEEANKNRVGVLRPLRAKLESES